MALIGKSTFFRFELVKSFFVLDAFNLVIPPYTMTYDGRYRDNIEKTFGGTFVDIQGMDNETIKITGTLSGKRTREGWAKVPGQALDNIGALKYFRDNIWKYPDNPRYSFMLDDLNVKFYDVELGEYRWIHINNVSINRDKSQPFWYNFSIQFTDIGPPKATGPLGALQRALTTYNNALQGAVNFIQQISIAILEPMAIAEQFVDTAFGFADATVNAIDQSFFILRETAAGILEFPGRIAERASETITNLLNVADQLQKIVDEDINLLLEYGPYLAHSLEEIIQATRLVAREINEVAIQSERNAIEEGTLDRGTEVSTAAVATTFIDSVQRVVIKEGQTLEEIALETYGDEKKAELLADFNGLETPFLPAGIVIKIPIYREQSIIEGNQVVAIDHNEYGVDFKTSEDSDIVISSTGDFTQITGDDNIKQVIDHIYKIDIGSLTSDTTFGFGKDELIGSTANSNALNLIGTKIKEALERDPRIAIINNLQYQINEDKVFVSGDIILHSGLAPIQFLIPITE